MSSIAAIRSGFRELTSTLSARPALTGVLLFPLLGYLGTLWLVKPLSLGDFSITLATPGMLLLAWLFLPIPREQVIAQFRPVRFEFLLLLVMSLLSVLSIVNHDSPIRILRVLFPCLVPFAIFAHYVSQTAFAPETLRRIPLLLLTFAGVFSITPLLASAVVPGLREALYDAYRYRGFFENPIQHSIALATLVPFLIWGFYSARSFRVRVGWGIFGLAFAFTFFQAGSKSALAIAFLHGVVLYLAFAVQSKAISRIFVALIVLSVLGAFLIAFGLPLADRLSPVNAEKIRSILDGGIKNYHSIESRQGLWRAAVEQGSTHWLVGSGGGEKILEVSHAHNVVLDYFKGIGLFGALAVFLLCMRVLVRCTGQLVRVSTQGSSEADTLALACFFSASIYVICNQLSDSFGPSTIGFLWVPYLLGTALLNAKTPSTSTAQS